MLYMIGMLESNTIQVLYLLYIRLQGKVDTNLYEYNINM